MSGPGRNMTQAIVAARARAKQVIMAAEVVEPQSSTRSLAAR
jgi:hypothetical protein